jgi:uncharacterized repeat protein (TIGR03803 family)
MLAIATLAQAQTFTTLYSFTGGSDGGLVVAGVIQDTSGNLYGTTFGGGNEMGFHGYGTVFELSNAGTESVLHSFGGSGDGQGPYTTVIRDSKGNIYGTTHSGGSYSSYGSVFKIDTAGSETLLHSFDNSSDGCHPDQGLAMDKKGNLYGTTYECGSFNEGTIYKIDAAGHFSVAHQFAGGPSDGANPYLGNLRIDEKDNLYGTTIAGGSSNKGVVYELSSGGTFTLLHSFAGGSADGCAPFGSVTRDAKGNLYGTTTGCGTHSGTIWKLGSRGKESILHDFSDSSAGCYPAAGVAFDLKGNLFGDAMPCKPESNGYVYELSAGGAFTILHTFTWSDGDSPEGEVFLSSSGTLYGTTYDGGAFWFGTVWSYVP